jgi:hypothetical protein
MADHFGQGRGCSVDVASLYKLLDALSRRAAPEVFSPGMRV